MQTVIGVLGAKRAGKDTFAAALIKNEPNFVRLGFADALYKEVSDCFDLPVSFFRDDTRKDKPQSELDLRYSRSTRFAELCQELLVARPEIREKFGLSEKALSPRVILQWYGTDFRRQLFDDNYWIDIVKDTIQSNPTRDFIITDVRFRNEVSLLVDKFDALTVRVAREKVDKAMAELRAAGDPAALHPSETELLDYRTHFIAENVEGDLESLARAVRRFQSEYSPF